MAVGLIEHTIMTNLRREYEAQGYSFYENPPPEAIPSFLGKFQPDAIAVRGEDGVVLELKPNTVKPDALKYIADRFVGQTRWQFRVIFYNIPEETSEEVEPPTIPFRELRARVLRLRDQGEIDAALLLGWATLESVVREKSAPSSYRMSTTLQIAERLEHFGVTTGEQAQLLRQSAVVRNAVAHGRFELRPGTGLIDVVLDVAQAVNQLKGRLPHQ